MDRNDYSHFSLAPQVDIERSTFNRDSTVKTSFNVGEVVPIYLEEVLPGDTFKISTSKIARMQTLKTPMMDDVFLDTYFFFVPNRLVWSHWKEFMGENNDSAWIPETEYTVPQITAPVDAGWSVGTIADYLGVPVDVDGISVNALPFRGYALIMQEWFRSEVLQDPLVIETGDSDVAGVNTGNYVTDVAKGGKPFIACKTMDYYSSALLSPQKGPDVKVELANGVLPVYTQGLINSYYAPFDYPGHGAWSETEYSKYKELVSDSYPVYWQTPVPANSTGTSPYPNIGSVVETSSSGSDQFGYMASNKVSYLTSPDSMAHPFTNVKAKDISFEGTNFQAQVPVNLVAGPTGAYSTINELRQAFQIQRFYEKCARGGTRYIEILKAHFGVTSPDARLQRPEYLGGSRLPLNVRQITQTSSTTDSQPLGDVAGMSVTTDNHFEFEKSFVEHGYIFGLVVARYNHSYQQGLDRTFSRKTKFDYYWPTFAHLGEQPIKNKEIFCTGSNTDDEVFGYQEAWADYRYKPNRVTGMMRSASNSGLDTWHLADDYESLPYLSASWIAEDKSNLDRVLTVTSAVSDQIFADFLIENKTTRPMPLYSIPGLIDHF